MAKGKKDVFLIGDIILERFLETGYGHESIAQHTFRRSAEKPMPSFYRKGGVFLTEHILKENLHADVTSRGLEIEDKWWLDPATTKEETGNYLVRQTFGIMPIEDSNRLEPIYRNERTLAFDYYKIPKKEENFEGILKNQETTYKVVIIEDFDLGGYDLLEDVVSNACKKAENVVMIKSSEPSKWVEKLLSNKETFEKKVFLLCNMVNFFKDVGVPRSWDNLIRETINKIKDYRSIGNFNILIHCDEGILMVSLSNKIKINLAWDRKVPPRGILAQQKRMGPRSSKYPFRIHCPTIIGI